jgi:hypothetical protein
MEYEVKPVINFTVEMKLTENEARALGAIALYGVEPFLKVFYTNMGSCYLKPTEKDFRELFGKIGCSLCSSITQIDEMKKRLREVK